MSKWAILRIVALLIYCLNFGQPAAQITSSKFQHIGHQEIPSGQQATKVDKSGRGWQPVSLDLDIRISPKSGEMEVSGVIGLRLLGESSSGPTLEIQGLMQFVKVNPPSEADVIIDVNNSRLAQIQLSKPVYRGAEIKISFQCTKISGSNSNVLVNDSISMASWNAAWYPFPSPQPGAPSNALMLRAPGKMTFHLPKGWRSVSNGELVEQREFDGEIVEIWNSGVSLPRSFAAAPYRIVRRTYNGRKVDVYYLASGKERAERQGHILEQVLPILEKYFGPYPYPGISLAEVPEGLEEWSGLTGLSHAGFIAVRMQRIESKGWELGVLTHELAHGWWGNLVKNAGMGGTMISEGVSHYAGAIAREAIGGDEKVNAFLNEQAGEYFAITQEKPLAQLGGEMSDATLAWTKGVWVLHMLRQEVGDKVFFATLRDLIQKFTNNFMSLDDFRRGFLDAAPGNTRLTEFFDQWFDRKGAPIIHVQWSAANDKDLAKAVVTIRQDGSPFRFPLDIIIDAKEGSRSHKVNIEGRQTRAILKAAGAPAGVRIDPNYRVLIWRPDYGPRPTIRE